MRFEDLIRRVRLSVAQITLAPGPTATPIGTGFLVGSGRYLITAKHVVDAAKNGAQLWAGIAGVDHVSDDLEIRAAFSHIPLDLIAQDDTHDLSLLELRLPPEAVHIELSAENIETGEIISSGMSEPMRLREGTVLEGADVAISGFPLAAPSLVTTRGIVASTFAPLSGAPDAPIAFLCDVTAISGNSGGPVYRTTDGAVIGVCTAVKLANVGSGLYSVPLTVVIPARHVIDLLRSAGIDHVPARTAPPSKPKRRR